MKVGDYVRAKDYLDNQLICKIEAIYNDFCNTDKGCWDNEHIIKSSPNIIDLIQEGDFITFQCISDDYDFEYMKIYTDKINSYEELISFKEAVDNEDLKLISIVTKEQFSQMEYRIEE